MKTLSEIYLSENERKALLCVKSEIEKHIPKSEIILYGMQQKKDENGEQILAPDWNALKAINPDIVGWIYVPDCAISYPVVQ